MSDCWICSKCSWVNKAFDASCKACGKSAPPDTSPSAYPSEQQPFNPTVPSGAVPSVYASAPPPYNPAANVAQPHVVTAQVITGTPSGSAPIAYTPYAPMAPPSAPTTYAPTAPSSYVPATPYAPAAPNVPDPSSNKEHWDCRACSWVNRLTDGTCKACGRNAPPGIVPAVVAAPVGLAHHSNPSATMSIPNGPPTVITHQGSSYNDTAFSSGFNKPNNHYTSSHVSAPAPNNHYATSHAAPAPTPARPNNHYAASHVAPAPSSHISTPALAGAPAAPQKQQDNGFVAGFSHHVPGRNDAPMR